MRIVDGKVIVCSPGRNFVTLKLVTEDGVHGLGDATLNGRELAVASYLTDHVIPLLVGRDARRIEDVWQYLYKGAYWRRGPVTMSAIAAVDTALWDIRGKTLNAPVYQLLGGASRESVMVYGHANGSTEQETVEAVATYLGMGYRAVRALLMRDKPRLREHAFVQAPGETATDFAVRVAPYLDGTVLPIQGPPGSGKTYTGARMILELVRRGMRVAVTANGHKVIDNLLAKVLELAAEEKTEVRCGHLDKRLEVADGV